MAFVEHQEFFHYQLDPIPYWDNVQVDPWEVGRTYFIGSQPNLYYDFFEQKGLGLNNQHGAFIPSVSVAEHIIQVRQGSELPDPAFGNIYTEHLHFLTSSLKTTASLVRELVFEDVRHQHFPELPSRQRCIWVMPSRDLASKWHQTTTGMKRWFRVSLTGRIHRASIHHLAADTISLIEWRNLAHKYWNGEPGGDPPMLDEVLFEGELRVIEQLTAADMGLEADYLG